MPKMKLDLDIAALEEAEYSDDEFSDYAGKIPPPKTLLTGYVKKMWLTASQNDDDMIVALWEAAENEGDDAQYDGLPIWEHMALIESTKFRWAPFLAAFGLTIRDVATKLVVDKDEDRIGAPILKIDKWEPGSDASWCQVLTKRDTYNDELQAKAAKWYAYDEADEEDQEDEADDEDEQEDEDLEDEDEEQDDEEDEDEEDEEEEEQPPPTRSRRTATRSATSTKAAAAKTPAKTAARTPARTAKAPAQTTRTTTRATGTSRRAATTKATPARATAKPAGRARGRGKATVDNEPPF